MAQLDGAYQDSFPTGMNSFISSKNWLKLYDSLKIPPAVRPIYTRLISHLQRNLLILLLAVFPPISIFWGFQASQRIWIDHTVPAVALYFHIITSVATSVLGMLFLKQRRYDVAWAFVLLLNLTFILTMAYVLQDSRMILFALLPLIGPTIFAPLWMNVLINGVLLTGLILIVYNTFAVYPSQWQDAAWLYAGIVCICMCVGVIIRRMVAQFAQITVDMQNKAIREAKLEQRVTDLHKHVATVASLEHDIRQPLRAMQGYLQMLQAEETCAANDDLITPALAAGQRANRLINNLLDLGRASIQQAHGLRQPADPAGLMATVQAQAPGLASYYTEPPVRLNFSTDESLPQVIVDGEQIQRAVFNLLDNALVHSPPRATIEVSSRRDGGDWRIEVADTGPGIPPAVIEALEQRMPAMTAPGETPIRLGLGLRQVYSAAEAHGGNVSIQTGAQGTRVAIRIPLTETIYGHNNGHRH